MWHWEVRAPPPCLPPPYSCTHLPKTSLTLRPLPYTPQFLVRPLREHEGGACESWGGRCYVSDLPLHEIGFGDIRIKRSVALPLPPPIARLAIMPGVSNHFSVKIPTASLFLSPPLTPHPSLSIPQHPWLSGSLSLFSPACPPPGVGTHTHTQTHTLTVWWSVAGAALQIPIDEDRGNWP